jgi:hypothetical protein
MVVELDHNWVEERAVKMAYMLVEMKVENSAACWVVMKVVWKD